MMRAIAIAGLLLACTTGCLDAEVTRCPGGLFCPAGTRCADRHGCLLTEQADACINRAENEACRFTGVPNGRCLYGAYVPAGCYAHQADTGEVACSVFEGAERVCGAQSNRPTDDESVGWVAALE